MEGLQLAYRDNVEKDRTTPSYGYNTAERVTEAVILCLISATALIGNTSLWIVILRSKRLKTCSNYLILCLSSKYLMSLLSLFDTSPDPIVCQVSVHCPCCFRCWHLLTLHNTLSNECSCHIGLCVRTTEMCTIKSGLRLSTRCIDGAICFVPLSTLSRLRCKHLWRAHVLRSVSSHDITNVFKTITQNTVF